MPIHLSVIGLSCPPGCQRCSFLGCLKLPLHPPLLLPPFMLLLFQSVNSCITDSPLPLRWFGQRATKLAAQFTSARRWRVSQASWERHISSVTMDQRESLVTLGSRWWPTAECRQGAAMGAAITASSSSCIHVSPAQATPPRATEHRGCWTELRLQQSCSLEGRRAGGS